MLILTRKLNESINIGKDIEIFVVEIKDDHVKIGVKAPKNIPVHRQEIYDSILKENELAAAASKGALQRASEALINNSSKNS